MQRVGVAMHRVGWMNGYLAAAADSLHDRPVRVLIRVKIRIGIRIRLGLEDMAHVHS